MDNFLLFLILKRELLLRGNSFEEPLEEFVRDFPSSSMRRSAVGLKRATTTVRLVEKREEKEGEREKNLLANILLN